jgi:lipoprotein-anchoring transpeptidase ErfK/SrfK
VIDRARTLVVLYDRGKRVMSMRAGVGARGSPTPSGRFYVREKVIPSNSGGIYGPVAFGLSAHSEDRTDWPGGGQVGVHGTNQPGLIPGRISNGCVRLRNRSIRRLARRLPVGTPVTIR